MKIFVTNSGDVSIIHPRLPSGMLTLPMPKCDWVCWENEYEDTHYHQDSPDSRFYISKTLWCQKTKFAFDIDENYSVVMVDGNNLAEIFWTCGSKSGKIELKMPKSIFKYIKEKLDHFQKVKGLS